MFKIPNTSHIALFLFSENLFQDGTVKTKKENPRSPFIFTFQFRESHTSIHRHRHLIAPETGGGIVEHINHFIFPHCALP